jgi:transcriptional regulator with GAF, ATPase, and Fis domain
MALLLDVWREACRHSEINESVKRIARLLTQRLPADVLLVRRLDLGKKRLETLATGLCRGARTPRQARTSVSPADIPAVLSWLRAAEPAVGKVSDRPLSLLVSEEGPADAIAVPLPAADNEILSVLVLLSYPPRSFTSEHSTIALQLVEPLAVALSNHARFSELGVLREALEADKRALLTRLERHDLTETVVGSEAGLRGVLERVTQVAPTDAPVLILGETGTGKEVIARAIHARSQRARGPVERVNCGAMPPGLIDSELFGHERGSFTGAVSERKGWFERANGGTLFLDEVAELPLDAQVRLLRILQDGTYERVGGHHTRTVDVRIVAATHRDLHSMVAQGTFREDLWYRISVFPIRLPPLRERREDLPALVAHFAARAGRRLGGVPLTPSAEDLTMVLDYDWPGNVRELAAVIERAVILGNGHHLDLAAALGTHHGTGVSASGQTLPIEQRNRPAVFGPISTLDEAMAEHIARALQITQGRIEGQRGAAALLGINPHTLRARMRKLGLDWKRFRAVAGARAKL